MNTPDSTESIFVQQTPSTGEILIGPGYPNPPDGRMPDLNLAGASGWPNSTGASIQVMPSPDPPQIYYPVLTGDPCMGGYEPSNPAPPAPNLAGVDGTPQVTMAAVAKKNSGWSASDVIQPDYIEPDYASLRQSVQPFNLIAPGIHLETYEEFEPDPMNPDLTDYNRPVGLDVHNIVGTGPALFKPDPLLGDLLSYDIPNGADVNNNPLTPDPNLPDLQPDQMQLTPDVVMTGRPGDLDQSAMTAMHGGDPTYSDQASLAYNRSFVDQSGMNNTRRRHMDLLMHGLDAEERS